MSNQQPQSSELNTGGGAFIKGAVHAGRDFIGRDQINHYARSQREELDDYLRKAISDYERDIERRRHPPTPDQPYKFLYPFTMADQAIFFGRDAAVEELLAKVGHPSRLTVLHAPSGAGKSSLLGAGLMPRLLDQDRLPLYVAVHQDAADPVLAIKKALTPESNGPWPELLPWLSLSAYLGEVTRHISRRFRDLVVILDQFEAFFVFSPEAVHRQPFINALADCLQDDSLPVRMVIALRKDYYSDLACFEPRLPYVFYNQYLLRPIDRREALIAITGPIEVVNPAVTLEETLITSLLDDLAHQEVRLPYLQIVCTQLYEECRSTTSSLTFTAYNKLGRTEGMLRRYLNQTLKWFGDRKNVAESILVALVTSAGTKLVVSKEALIGQIDTDPDTVQDVLAHLVGRRLLQVTQESGRVTYELAHEALGAEIEDWINPDVLLSKRILEMLQSEIANWRMFGTLIPKERLNLLSSYRKKILHSEDFDSECVFFSALQENHEIQNWFSVDEKIELCLNVLQHPTNRVRRLAYRELSIFWGIPCLEELISQDYTTRVRAISRLGKSGDKRTLKPLIAALSDIDPNVQANAALAIGQLDDEKAVPHLIQALKANNEIVRANAAIALGHLRDKRSIDALITTFTTDPEPVVRADAARALGALGGDLAVESLTESLSIEIPSVQIAVLEALSVTGDSRVFPFLINALHQQSAIRPQIVEALINLNDPQSVAPLIQAMSYEDPELRCYASEALGYLGDTRAFETLITALASSNFKVRTRAAEALGRLADCRATSHLIDALNDRYANVRCSAAIALGRVHDGAAVQSLSSLLSDSDADVRCSAAWALGKLLDPSAVNPLIQSFKDEDRLVRNSAVEALETIGTPEALAALERYRQQQSNND